MTRPIILVSDETSFESTVTELEDVGWTIHRGWRLGDREWSVSGQRLVCVGAVPTFDEVNAALIAALRGAGIVALVEPGEPCRRLTAELRHLGTVETRDRPAGGVAELSEDQLELCRLLGHGLSIGEAASAMHVSRRTAARRLASVRETLGVATTREAVLLACSPSAGPRRMRGDAALARASS